MKRRKSCTLSQSQSLRDARPRSSSSSAIPQRSHASPRRLKPRRRDDALRSLDSLFDLGKPFLLRLEDYPFYRPPLEERADDDDEEEDKPVEKGNEEPPGDKDELAREEPPASKESDTHVTVQEEKVDEPVEEPEPPTVEEPESEPIEESPVLSEIEEDKASDGSSAMAENESSAPNPSASQMPENPSNATQLQGNPSQAPSKSVTVNSAAEERIARSGKPDAAGARSSLKSARPPEHELPPGVGEGILPSGKHRESVISSLPISESSVMKDMMMAEEKATCIREEIKELKKVLYDLQNKDDLTEDDSILMKDTQAMVMQKIGELNEITRKLQRTIGLCDPSTKTFAKMFEMLPIPHTKCSRSEAEAELCCGPFAFTGTTRPAGGEKFAFPQIEHPEDKLPRVIICGDTEEDFPKIVVADSCPKRFQAKCLAQLPGRLNDALCMSEKLVRENADLEGGKFILEQELLQKDNAVDCLQRKVCGLQAEMRLVVRENSELSRKVCCLERYCSEKPPCCPPKKDECRKPPPCCQPPRCPDPCPPPRWDPCGPPPPKCCDPCAAPPKCDPCAPRDDHYQSPQQSYRSLSSSCNSCNSSTPTSPIKLPPKDNPHRDRNKDRPKERPDRDHKDRPKEHPDRDHIRDRPKEHPAHDHEIRPTQVPGKDLHVAESYEEDGYTKPPPPPPKKGEDRPPKKGEDHPPWCCHSQRHPPGANYYPRSYHPDRYPTEGLPPPHQSRPSYRNPLSARMAANDIPTENSSLRVTNSSKSSPCPSPTLDLSCRCKARERERAEAQRAACLQPRSPCSGGTPRLAGGANRGDDCFSQREMQRSIAPSSNCPQPSPPASQRNVCPAEIEERLAAYGNNTKFLGEQLSCIETEVRTLQSELLSVQRERQQLEQQRKLLECAGPCATCPCSGQQQQQMPMIGRMGTDNGNNEVSESNSCAMQQLRDLREQYARLQDDYKSKLCEVSRLRTDAETLKRETREAKDERERYEIKLIDAQERLRVIECERNSLLGAKEQLIEQEQQLQVAKQRFREAQDEVEELRTMIRDQASQLDDYRNKYLQAQQIVEEQRRQLDLMEMDNARMNENVTLEIGRVKSQFQEKLAELAPLPDILKQTQIKLQETQQLKMMAEHNCEDLSRELLGAKDKIDALNGQIGDLQRELQNLQEERDSCGGKTDELEKRNSELRNENERLKSTCNRLEEAQAQLQKRMDEKQHEIVQLTAMLEQVREDSARQVARTKERCEAIKRSMQAQISDFEIQLAQCRAAAKTAQKERDEIRQKMQGQIGNLNEALQQAQGRIRSLQGHVDYLKVSYSTVFGGQGQGETNNGQKMGTESPTPGYDSCDCTY